MGYRVRRFGDASTRTVWEGDDPSDYHGTLGCCEGEYTDDGPENLLILPEKNEFGVWAEMPIAEFDQLRGLGK